MRAAGGGELRLGKKVEEFTAIEVADDDKAAGAARLPQALEGARSGVFFNGVGPDSTDEELRRIAPEPPGLPHREARGSGRETAGAGRGRPVLGAPGPVTDARSRRGPGCPARGGPSGGCAQLAPATWCPG